jgi:hypothetical protein
MLKLLQWKNPRQHWLLKAPSHLGNLPVVFDTFPDARVVITHRDPIVAQASVTNLLGTLYWMRSSQDFDAGAFENLMTPEAGAARLNGVVDLLDSGTVPTAQIHHFLYADLVSTPANALTRLYQEFGEPISADALTAMQRYLENKPQGKFGKHNYSIGEQQEIELKRGLYERYQSYFGISNEF